MKLFIILTLILLTTNTFAEDNKLFIKNCGTCHSAVKGDTAMRAGPNLWGVIGRKAGTQQSYTMYSAAIKNSGIVWDEKHLDKWLTNAGMYVQGTNMFYMQSDEMVRKSIINYLRTLK